MPLTKDQIAEALRGIVAPDGADLVGSGCLRSATTGETFAGVKLHLPGCVPGADMDRLSHQVGAAIDATARSAGSPVGSVVVEFVDKAGTVVHAARFGTAPPHPTPVPQAPGGGHRPIQGLGQSKAATPQGAAKPMPNVKYTVAVGAGKGGVGKSTIALNLAVGLARKGLAVGLMDGDIYGPSLPTLLNLHPLEASVVGGMLQPFLVHGIKAMTIGKLVDPEKALIWRGPMAHGAFKQLAEQTNWGELDYLIIDLPPGTGDVPLTMAQILQLTGAVVVCTPQRVAQDDAVRATRMFQQLGVDVLGVVENMSVFVGDDGKEYEIFGKGGAETMAQKLNVPFLGAVPLTMALRKNSDSGDPTSNFSGGGALRGALDALVTAVENQVALASMRQGQTRPTLTIS